MSNPNESGGHPAYQHILDALPESLHSVILPELKKWDAGVTQKFQEIHASYEPLKAYQKLAEHNIDPAYAEQAVTLADQLQADPTKVINQVNEAWGLGFVSKEQAEALKTTNVDPDDDGDFDLANDDILNHPQVKAMQAALEQIQNDTKTRQELEEEEAQIAEFEAALEELEAKVTKDNLPFNRLFVTALMQQGIDGEEAVKQYHEVLALNTSTDNPPTDQVQQQATDAPPVMGNGDNAGSGLPDGTVNFGSLSKNQLNDTVMQMLAQQQSDSGQG